MFRKKRNRSIEVTKLSSLIADNVQIVGDVVFSGGLRVDGHIEGNVINKDSNHGLLVLSHKGSIKGKVRVYDAVVNGTITGDLEVEHFLELQSSAKVSGNISYRQLQMDCGAAIDGKLEKIGPGAAESKPAAEAKVVEISPPGPQAAAR